MTKFLAPLCYHMHQTPYSNFLHCGLCGTNLNNPRAPSELDFGTIKDEHYNTQADISPAQLYINMLNDQHISRYYNLNADYVTIRGDLITWLKEINTQLNLSIQTFHIAISYLDYSLSKVNFPCSEHYKVALTCFILAAKYDELDRNIPPISKFLNASRFKLRTSQVSDIRKCEAKILEILSWNLKVITPIVFIELLLTQGVIHDSDKTSKGKSPDKFIAKAISESAIKFAEQALYSILMLIRLGYEITQFDPSIIGICCIMSGRQSLELPAWSEYLGYITSVDYEKVKNCYEMLTKNSHMKQNNVIKPENIPKTITDCSVKYNELSKRKQSVNLGKHKIEGSIKNINEMLNSLNEKTIMIERMLAKDCTVRTINKEYKVNNTRANLPLGSSKTITNEIMTSLENIQKIKKNLEELTIADRNMKENREVFSIGFTSRTAKNQNYNKILFKETNRI